MKRNFCSIALMAILSIMSLTFVSCEKENEGKKEEEHLEPSFSFELWYSQDLLDIVDVKCEGLSVPYEFTEDVERYSESLERNIKGKTGGKVELKGDDARNANVKITLTLKENWKEIVGSKTEMELARRKWYAAYIDGAYKGTDENISSMQDLTEIKENKENEEIFADLIKDYYGFSYPSESEE